MRHISILIPAGESNLSTIACIAGAFEIFTAAIKFQEQQQSKKLFEVQTVSATTNPVKVASFTLHPDLSVDSITNSDLIIIPSSLVRGYESATKGNQILIDWIREQYGLGAEVASMCAGAFMLAATGILHGRNCSTHWRMAENFRELFPAVHLTSERLITDEDGIYTNGGAYSFLHLILYLVEKYFDRATAIHCSKVFQIDVDRKLQSPFSTFSGYKKHSDDIVLKAQDFIEKNYQEKLSIAEISLKYNVGRRNFDRRFIKATGFTPLDYLQRIKIEAAKSAFENTRKTVSEVMFDVGYNDTKAFREVFSRITGISPVDYKMKFKRTAVIN